jgi:hypothetical protein
MFKNSIGLKYLDKHLHIAESIKEHVLDFIAISEMGKRNYSKKFLNRLSGGKTLFGYPAHLGGVLEAC